MLGVRQLSTEHNEGWSRNIVDRLKIDTDIVECQLSGLQVYCLLTGPMVLGSPPVFGFVDMYC